MAPSGMIYQMCIMALAVTAVLARSVIPAQGVCKGKNLVQCSRPCPDGIARGPFFSPGACSICSNVICPKATKCSIRNGKATCQPCNLALSSCFINPRGRVCGSDGKDYPNSCAFQCTGVSINKFGPCKRKTCKDIRCSGQNRCKNTPRGPICFRPRNPCEAVKCRKGQKCVNGKCVQAGSLICPDGILRGPVPGDCSTCKNVICPTATECVEDKRRGQISCAPCNIAAATCSTAPIAPICASDGKTYTTGCAFLCTGISFNRKGPCQTTCPDCVSGSSLKRDFQAQVLHDDSAVEALFV